MKLSELKTGEEAIIVKIHGHGAFRRRVMEMGFVRGKRIRTMLNAPLEDPIKYSILDYAISLRRSEADLIEVTQDEGEVLDTAHLNADHSIDAKQPVSSTVESIEKTIKVALIGNPNCGKTSLFNVVCGTHLHVGNYSGVTVDATSGAFDYKGYHFEFVDLPGTYSLSAYSPEELYVRRYLKDEEADVILNVLDGSNLERNLYLTTELIDMDRSMVIALNMYDEFLRMGYKLDVDALGTMIGVPIVPTVSKYREGINTMLDTLISVYERTNKQVRHVHVNVGKEIETAITQLRDFLHKNDMAILQFSTRYLAIKLLEKDEEIESVFSTFKNYKELIALRDSLIKGIEQERGEDLAAIIASEKYGYIAGALRETLSEPKEMKMDYSHAIDKFVTSKAFGFPIFILILLATFWLTFTVGQYPMDWIDAGVGWIKDLLSEHMASGALKDLLVEGIIGGVGSVIVFLPNILILYFCLSFMEDSGYMARAAFIMDRIMHRLGLHGKSFIPLIMGFGCNVPAIIGTRCIESRSSRLITAMILPFMSCNARLPIFVLLIGTFFPEHPALMFLMLYALGVIVAMITSRLLRSFDFFKDEAPFVMELPPYRLPTLKSTISHMWEKGKQYLHKMGGVILVGSIIVWGLSYFPRDINKSNDEMTPQEIYDQQNESYLASIGKVVAYPLHPLGMDWKTSIALISGATAKEIVVSSLGVLYPYVENGKVVSVDVDEDEEDGTAGVAESDSSLGTRLKRELTPLQGLSLMVFVLLYFPCIAAVVAVAKECGSWKYGAFSVFYNTGIAWIVSFAVYQIGLLLL